MCGGMDRLQPAILCLIITVAALARPVRSQHRFDCEENFCGKKENQCPELDCENGRIVKNATVCGCCDVCVESLGEGVPCSNTEFGWSPDLKECGSCLFCNKGKCEATECLKKLRKYNKENSEHRLQVNFTCEHFGDYDPVVCISDILCFCVNKLGKRIFGTDFAANNGFMTCDCSRDIEAFPKEVEDKSFFPRCLHNGNYDSLQCTEDKCFCMESSNKNKDVTNDASSIRKLSCYDNLLHDNGRTTKCLKEREEQMKLFRKNYTVIGIEPVRCDLDGSYFPKQCNPGRCFCVSRNGRIYEDTTIKKRDAEGMTCRCIRDKEIVLDRIESLDNSKHFMDLECDKLGNYKSKSNAVMFPMYENKSFFDDFM